MIDHPLTPSADVETRALIQENRKIDAIKLVREKTGLGLKEAKDRVELITGLLAWWWLRG